MIQNLPPRVASPVLIEINRSAQRPSNSLTIGDWKKVRTGANTRVSAAVDGFEVYFEGACLADAPERADAFLAVGLLQAMRQNRPLDLTALPPLSAGLLEHINQMQDIWCCWNPYLHRIRILATEAETLAGSTNLTFFSGGVGAVYTALALGEKAGRLVFVHGFDFDTSQTVSNGAYQCAVNIATLLGRELLTVQTNWITYTRNLRIAHSTSHGSCLAAIAYLLNPAEAFIASATSWLSMYPWGTHPFLDNLWGTNRMKVHHHGKDATWPEKIAAIALMPEVLKHLCVCHEKPAHNCGRCRKCLRTRATLTMLGADTSAFPAAQGDTVKQWLLVEASDPSDKAFMAEILLAVKETGRKDLLKILANGEKKSLRRNVIQRLWRGLLPGLAAKRDASADLLPWGSGPHPDL